MVPTSPDQPLREIFNEAAELYDRVRPGYPPRLFDDLAELAGLGSGSRVLEIGCGTGQATVPLAERAGHPDAPTEGFFVDVQDCYERFDPATPPGLRQSSAAQVPADGSELDGSGRFGQVIFRRYEWEQPYRADEYLDLLRTYSGHRALPEPARRGLLECVTQLINSRYGGQITKRYLTRLVLAHRS